MFSKNGCLATSLLLVYAPASLVVPLLTLPVAVYQAEPFSVKIHLAKDLRAQNCNINSSEGHRANHMKVDTA